MKNKFLAAVLFLLLTAFSLSAKKAPKYVFYFIGDGMGANVVQLAEMYRASMNGHLGVEPLVFSQFPVVSFGTTYSADNDVTDSAASGTALATGTKTNNYTVGLGPDGQRLTPIAEKAHKKGVKVGIMTTDGINHATPAAFYAHQQERSMFYEISLDLISSGYDFFASQYIERTSRLNDGTKVKNIKEVIAENGYTIAYGIEEFETKRADASKMLLLPVPKKGSGFQIDRRGVPEAVGLTGFVKAAISFLYGKDGFFIMAEASKIDGAGHGHDAATSIYEVLDLNNAVTAAYEFYKQHPDETLIVVTADHDTGCISLDPETPNDLTVLQYQKNSQEKISSILDKKLEEVGTKSLTWEETKEFLAEYTGLWTKVPVSKEQEEYLVDTYNKTLAVNERGHQIDLYADNALLVARAIKVLNENAHIKWGTESHSSGYVPVFAIGPGSEQFSGKMDNSLIPRIITQIAKY